MRTQIERIDHERCGSSVPMLSDQKLDVSLTSAPSLSLSLR